MIYEGVVLVINVFRYPTTLDKERAMRWVYYEYDHSTDIYDEATDQVSKTELKEMLKVLKSDSNRARKQRKISNSAHTTQLQTSNN